MKIDNFALTMFQSCPLKYRLRMVEGWTTRRKSAALGFGAAIHEGLAEWYRTGNKGAAISAIAEAWPAIHPVDDYRTRDKCIKVMAEYILQYPEESFTVVGMPESPMVERTFTLMTGMYLRCGVCTDEDHSHHTDPICSSCGLFKEVIEYGGIFDALVEFSGTIYVLEHKSTSQLGSYYFNQFKPNNQVTGYCWAGGELSGLRVGGAMINAIGVYKSSATKFERELTSRSADEIAEWKLNVYHWCEKIKACERASYWPMNTVSCTMYGQCEFHQVHTLGNEKERGKLLEQDYVKSDWSYEARDDGKDNG